MTIKYFKGIMKDKIKYRLNPYICKLTKFNLLMWQVQRLCTRNTVTTTIIINTNVPATPPAIAPV